MDRMSRAERRREERRERARRQREERIERARRQREERMRQTRRRALRRLIREYPYADGNLNGFTIFLNIVVGDYAILPIQELMDILLRRYPYWEWYIRYWFNLNYGLRRP